MCLYSLHTRDINIRKARVGETLTRGEHRQHICFLGDDGMLACIKPGTQVLIKHLQFGHGNQLLVNQPDGHGWRSMPVETVDAWNGKEDVRGTFIRWGDRRGYSADCIRLEDGVIIHMGWMHKGTKMSLPRKVRKDKGLKRPRNLDKVLGLDQIRADAPVIATVDA